MSLIDPSALVGQPLRLRRTAPDDYAVLIADKLTGRIMRKPVARGGDVWLWTVTCPYLPPNLQPSTGDAASLEEAKEAFKLKFMVWLHWAVFQGGEVHWHGGAEKTVP